MAKEPYIKAGTVFNRLTALEDAERYGDKIWWRCEDGNEKLINCGNVKEGRSRSCGCLRLEKTRTLAVRSSTYKNDIVKHPLYRTWRGMKVRTSDLSHRRYGGRGIQMLPAWRDDSLAFITWIEANLGPKPGPGYTLDRIDNDGNYEPGNMRWATKVEQARNRGGTLQDEVARLQKENAELRKIIQDLQARVPAPAAA